MDICITPKSIKSFGAYFKNLLPDVIDENTTYEDLIKDLFDQAISDFKSKETGGYDTAIILQHLSIIPQLADSYIANTPGLSASGNLRSELGSNAKSIFDSIQSNQKQQLVDELVKLGSIVGLSEIEIVKLSEAERYDAVAEIWGRTLVQESIWDLESGYKENVKDPRKNRVVNTQRNILADNNINGYRFQFLRYDDILNNPALKDKLDDQTDYRLFPDKMHPNMAVMVIVNEDGEMLSFDEQGNVAENGLIPLIPVRNTKSAFQYQLEARANSLAGGQMTYDNALKELEKELDAHLSIMNSALERSTKEPVYFEMNMGRSSAGFIELSQQYAVPLANIDNKSELNIFLETERKANIPKVSIPLTNTSHPIQQTALVDMSQQDKDMLFELLFNPNLVDQNGEPLSSDIREQLLENYIQKNFNRTDKPIIDWKFGSRPVKDKKTGKIIREADPNRLTSVKLGSKSFPLPSRTEKPEYVEKKRAAFKQALNEWMEGRQGFTTNRIDASSRDTAESLDNVRYDGQYYTDEFGEIKIGLRPQRSFGLKTQIGPSMFNDERNIATSIQNDVVQIGRITHKQHVINTGKVATMPTKTTQGTILRGHGAYIAFDPMIDKTNTPMGDDTSSIKMWRSLSENNAQAESMSKEQVAERMQLNEAATQWYNNHPIAKVLKKPVFVNGVSEKGPQFVANFFRDTITLYSGSQATDLYHETFHAYFDGILTQQEREDIYNELKALPGTFSTTVLGVKKTLKFSEATPLELEEYLAEEFRMYAQERSKYNKQPKSKVARFFKKLFDMIKSLFGNRTPNELILLNQLGPIAKAAFVDLYDGNIDASKFEAPKDNSYKWQSTETEGGLKLSHQEVSTLMSSTQALMADWMRTVLNSQSNKDKIFDLAGKMSALATLDSTSPDYRTKSREIRKQIKEAQVGGTPNGFGIARLNENPLVLETALTYVKNIFEQKLALYKQDKDSVIAQENVKMLEKALEHFGDPKLPKDSYRLDNSTIIGLYLNNYSNIKLVEVKDDERDIDDSDLELEEEIEKRFIYGTTGAEYSIADSASKVTVQLLSSIIKFNNQGQGDVKVNRLGIGRLLPYRVAIGKVARITKGLTTPEQMYDALVKAAITDAEIAQIVNMLGDYRNENKRKLEWDQWKSFWQDILKADQDVIIVNLEKEDAEAPKNVYDEPGKSTYKATVGRSDVGVTNVRREWAGNFTTSLERDGLVVRNGKLIPSLLTKYAKELRKLEAVNMSDEELRNIAKFLDVKEYEYMTREELFDILTSPKLIPISGSNDLYHTPTQAKLFKQRGIEVKYKNAGKQYKFFDANPFPLLKALGIYLPETKEVRDILLSGDVDRGLESKVNNKDILVGIPQLIYNSLYNRDFALDPASENPVEFLDFFKGYSYTVYDEQTGDESGVETQPSIFGYLKELAALSDSFSDENVTFMGRNAEGEMQSERPMHSALTLTISEINNAMGDEEGYEAYQQLIAIPGLEWLDYKNNPSIAANKTFVQMFNLDKIGRQFGKRNTNIKINIRTLGGSKVSYNGLDKGISSLASDEKTKYISDFLLTLEGRQETPRAEAKATSVTVYFPRKKFNDQKIRTGLTLSNEEIIKINSPNYKGTILYEEFSGHLEAELIRIARINEVKERVKKGEQIEFDSDFLERGDKFWMFDLILTPGLKQRLLAKGITESFTIDNILSDKEKFEIENALKGYLNYKAQQEFDNYDEELFIADNTIEKFALEGENINDPEKPTRKRMHQVFIYNNFLQNANYSNLFLGDLAIYNIEGQDYHKRIAGLISTGRMFMFSDKWYKYVSSAEYNAKGLGNQYKEKIGKAITPYEYQGFLKTAVIKEAVFDSVYKDHYDKFFKAELEQKKVAELKEMAELANVKNAKKLKKAELVEALLFETEEYKRMKEADGAAYITLDTYRMLGDSSDDWSPEQERIYQQILKGEEIDELKLRSTFPVKKYQHYGNVTNDNAKKNVKLSMTAFHKYSLMPLIPGVIDGTKLEELNNRMMAEDIDYVTFESGSKLSTIRKISENISESESDNVYNEEREITNAPFTINKIHVRNLKNQVPVNEFFKGKITLWTQMRSMVTLGLNDNGIPMDYMGNPSVWYDLSEDQKWQESELYRINKDLVDTISLMQRYLKNQLLEDLGLRKIETQRGDGTVAVTYDGSSKNMANYIKRKLQTEELMPKEIESLINPANGELIEDLSFSLHAEKIEQILVTMVDKKLRRLKINGEALTQVSGAMWEKSGVKVVADTNTGTNGLKTYYLKDKDGNPVTDKSGDVVIQKMEVKIALQGDFLKLLKLKHPDKKKIEVRKKDGSVDMKESVKRLNESIANAEWFDANEKYITIPGPRIPSQQENSLEAAVIKEFLLPRSGPIIVLPSEVVAKAGSDFDHDKLMMAFPNIAMYADGSLELYTYDSSLENVTHEELKEDLKRSEASVKKLRKDRKSLVEEKESIFSEFEQINKQVNTEFKSQLKKQSKLRKEWVEANGHIEAAEAGNWIYKNLSKSERRDAVDKFTEIRDEINEKQQAIFDKINARRQELVEQSGLITDTKKALLEDVDKRIAEVDQKLKTARKALTFAQKRKNGKSVKGLENRLLDAMVRRITNKDNIEALIQNNSTYLVKPISEQLEDLVRGKYNKYDSGPYYKENLSKVTGTTLMDYRFNNLKHQENSVGMNSLGIAAVTATFHAMFTQMGAYLVGVSEQDKKAFDKAVKTLTFAEKDSALYKDALALIDQFSGHTIKFKHNTVQTKLGTHVALGFRKNVDGQTISSVIGQLINGYVDVAKEAWVFNIQGNKQNTPVLLLMVMAGVSPRTAVLFSSLPLVRKYNRLKTEMTGVYSNLTNEYGISPIIGGSKKESAIEVIKRKARQEMLMSEPYRGIILKELAIDVSHKSFGALANRMRDDYTNDDLLEMVSGDPNTIEQLEALAHYMQLENISGDLTQFTQNTKYSTEKIGNLTDAKSRMNRTEWAKVNTKSSIPVWMYEKILETPNGVTKNDEFYIDLISRFFKLRNHEMLVYEATKLKVPDGIDKTVARKDMLNDFMAFVFQNEIFSTDSYDGYTFEITNNSDVTSYIDNEDPQNPKYVYNPEKLKQKIQQIQGLLSSQGALNQDLLNKFPTDLHYIRYDIEYQKILEENEALEELSDAELRQKAKLAKIENYEKLTPKALIEALFKQKYYYAYDQERGITSKSAATMKLALFNSYNNIAMFDYRVGLPSILNQIVKKHPNLELQYDIIADLKKDYDKDLRKQNFYLQLKSDPDAIATYEENVQELKNSKIPEVAEFFRKFEMMALFQTGMNRRSKYDLARTVDQTLFSQAISKETRERIVRALDEAYDKILNKAKRKDIEVPYLDTFLEIFNEEVMGDNYRVRNKGVNYVTGNKELVSQPIVKKAGLSDLVTIISSEDALPSTEILVDANEFFNENGEIDYEMVAEYRGEKFYILDTKLVAPNPEVQAEFDEMLFNEFGIDNTGAIPRLVSKSIGQTATNISIATATGLKRNRGIKDEAMANNATVAIGKATIGNTSYTSSSQLYVDTILDKYPKRLANDETKFKASDKVWIFGSNVNPVAAKGVEGATQKASLNNFENMIKSTFNSHHKPLINKAIAAGVTTFNVGTGTGNNQFALEYLIQQGFIPVPKYTAAGKYYELMPRNKYKHNSETDYFNALGVPINLRKTGEQNPTFDGMRSVLYNDELQVLKDEINQMDENELIDNPPFEKVKAAIIAIKSRLFKDANAEKFGFFDPMFDSDGRFNVGNDVASSYIEQVLLDIRKLEKEQRELSKSGKGINISQKIEGLRKVNIAFDKTNRDQILAGTKMTTLRSKKQSDSIGLKRGDEAIMTIDGNQYLVTARGEVDVYQAGGKQSVVINEGLPTTPSEAHKFKIRVNNQDYYTKYFQTAQFINGERTLYQYTFTRIANPVEEKSNNFVLEPGRYVTYTNPKGEKSTYIVTEMKGTDKVQIYNPLKQGQSAKITVSRNNVTTLSTKSKIVNYRNADYIVTPKNTIISLVTNRKMNWSETDGNRKAILELATTPVVRNPNAENITTKGSLFAKQLTNPGNNLQVKYKGRTFRNAEHAYQTYKSGTFDEVAFKDTSFKPKGSKPVDQASSYQTMVDILTAKLQQHPSLVKGIQDRGGISYLEESTHEVYGTERFWETSGQNKFIEALTDAYKSVTQPQAGGQTSLFDKLDDNDVDNLPPLCGGGK
jgi:hypothetical protein